MNRECAWIVSYSVPLACSASLPEWQVVSTFCSERLCSLFCLKKPDHCARFAMENESLNSRPVTPSTRSGSSVISALPVSSFEVLLASL